MRLILVHIHCPLKISVSPNIATRRRLLPEPVGPMIMLRESLGNVRVRSLKVLVVSLHPGQATVAFRNSTWSAGMILLKRFDWDRYVLARLILTSAFKRDDKTFGSTLIAVSKEPITAKAVNAVAAS